MAKAAVGPSKSETYNFPSRYGSHTSMVISQEGDKVICRDEFGEYFTYKDRIDNNLADPSRYSANHRRVRSKEELASITEQFGPGAEIILDSAKNLNQPAPSKVSVNESN